MSGGNVLLGGGAAVAQGLLHLDLIRAAPLATAEQIRVPLMRGGAIDDALPADERRAVDAFGCAGHVNLWYG